LKRVVEYILLNVKLLWRYSLRIFGESGIKRFWEMWLEKGKYGKENLVDERLGSGVWKVVSGISVTTRGVQFGCVHIFQMAILIS